MTKIKTNEIRETFENLLLPGIFESARDGIDHDLLGSEFAGDPVKAVVDFILEKASKKM